MENYRSKSLRHEKVQIENYNGSKKPAQPSNSMHDLMRIHSSNWNGSSFSHVPPQGPPPPPPPKEEVKVKRLERSSTTIQLGCSSKTWSALINDPELQRKKRVTSYKAYAVEGKMKASLRKSFKWAKDTFTHVFQ